MPASIAPTGQSAERQALGFEDSLSQAALSTALVSVFRGKFCDAILPNRKAVAFKKEQVIYEDRKSTRLNSSHVAISYAVFCLKKKKKKHKQKYNITIKLIT